MNIFKKTKIVAVGLFCSFAFPVFSADDPFCCHHKSVKEIIADSNFHLYFGVMIIIWLLFKLLTKCTVQEKFLTALCVASIWIFWFI
ncbi:hypothetical protein [Arsenophonus nasoniae]|uniref:hypothetical protein n=1 Tax=Arsenophonus nasoniae TaxID=638 RepID=UPI00387A7962